MEIIGHVLARMHRNGQIRRYGPLCLRDRPGKPPWVYSCGVKEDWLAHETGITEVWLRYRFVPWVRGLRLDKRLRADAEIREDWRTLYVELDRGTERTRILTRRLATYEQHRELFKGTKDTVLWIVPDDDRRQELIALAQEVESFSYFGLFQDVLADPLGPVWMDTQGTLEPLWKASDGSSDSPVESEENTTENGGNSSESPGTTVHNLTVD
jgi:hypothetical protein